MNKQRMGTKNMEELKRYKGELNREQMIIARNKIINNAKSLYEEATILYNHDKYARAYYLLCIANEELGKSIIVTSGIVDFLGDNIDWKTFWKRLRNHKDKTGTIEHIENIFISNDENFCNPKDVQDRIPTFEEVKMISLYSDMIQNDFYEPCEIIQKEMVQAYHKLTGKRIDFVTAISVSDFTLRNIDKEKAKEHIKWLKSFFRKE